MAQASLVLDCADSFAVSYILSDTCLAAGVPLVSASVLGVSGYVGGFCGTAPSLRAVFPDLPDRAATCATAGVMGPVVGMIGAAQAQMALACLTGQTPSPLGHLLTVDMQAFRSSSFRFDTAPEPAQGLHFIATDHLKPTDIVVDLRGTEEAPTPVSPQARRSSVSDVIAGRLQPPRPDSARSLPVAPACEPGRPPGICNATGTAISLLSPPATHPARARCRSRPIWAEPPGQDTRRLRSWCVE